MVNRKFVFLQREEKNYAKKYQTIFFPFVLITIPTFRNNDVATTRKKSLRGFFLISIPIFYQQGYFFFGWSGWRVNEKQPKEGKKLWMKN